MIVLSYPFSNPQIEEWKGRLFDLVLQHRLVENTNLKEPELHMGSHIVKGEKAISKAMNQLSFDAGEWCKCVCD